MQKIIFHQDLGQRKHFSDITLVNEETERAFFKQFNNVQLKIFSEIEILYFSTPRAISSLGRKILNNPLQENQGWNLVKLWKYHFHGLCFYNKLGVFIQTNHLENRFLCFLGPIWVMYMWGTHKKGGKLHTNSQKTVLFKEIFFFSLTFLHLILLNLQ